MGSDDYRTRIWYQPTFARAERLADFADDGYRGCVGRTLDRISIFPDGRAYVCSYLFDTSLNFMQMEAAVPQLNKGPNEMDLFTSASVNASCTQCRQPGTCQGGCPAERVVEGSTICEVSPDLHSVCRL